ncbi:class I SAM-dependent DNA methyltransferase [Fischerella sp. PCC 9605]|uniref:class I SAM-dependent DNA methyltransferase n=1 Tax=Fischerella sp. PCC 9605 TaxID=1173024 RepID=UPI00047C17FC|nr:class I SAM-dependent methyltransferase [Fischerella sp. PCC 9605]
MSLVKNDANHDRFASVFNLLPSEAEFVMPVLEQLMLKHLPKGAHILDIGCSNGYIVQQLQKRGYQATGLDVSGKLLSFARINSPESKFIHEDIRNFKSPPTYDAVYSKNALCFFMSLEELTTVFQNIYTAMHDNALFMFSIPTADIYWRDGVPEDDYIGYGYTNTHCYVGDTFVFIERENYHYKPEERIREVAMTIFELIDGIWKRTDSRHLVKDYFLSEIKAVLENVGFIEINDCNIQDFGEDYKGYDQHCIICRKPSLSQ